MSSRPQLTSARGSSSSVSLAAVVVALSALTIVVAMAATVAADHGQSTRVAFFAALVAYVAAMAFVPVPSLPAVALAVTLLVPMTSSLLPVSAQGTPIGAIPLVVWLIRAPAPAARRWLPYCAGVALAGWMVLSEIAAPLHKSRGVEWLVTAVVCLVLPATRQRLVADTSQIRTWLLRITTPVACYALLEGFVLHRNVLFAFLYRGTEWWTSQQASVSYRATTLFGHPLVNGAIFAVAGTLAASEFVNRSDRPWWRLFQMGVFTGAVLATHSRGPAVALGAGIILVVIFSRRVVASSGVRRAILIAGAVLAGAIIYVGLQARAESAVGQSSAAVRVTVVSEALQAVHAVEPFGAGPGQSDAYRVANGLPGATGTVLQPLENSYAQLLVSLGFGGLGLFVLTVLSIALPGLRRPGVVGEAAALLVLLIAIGGFNALEGFPPVLVLMATLMLPLAAGPASAVVEHPPGAVVRRPPSPGRRGRHDRFSRV